MKSLILTSIALLLLISCNSSNDFSMEDIYTGTLTIYDYNSYNGLTDTTVLSMQLKLDNKNFVELNKSGEEGCKGDVKTRKQNLIIFESSECSCWCDCANNVDCGGSPILGEHTITSDGTDVLRFDRNWTYLTGSGALKSIDYIYDLKKQ